MPGSTKILLLFLGVLYIAFPTSNSTVDSFYYAATVKHGIDLLLPHHLLYNATGFIFYKLLNITGWYPDALAFLKVLNAIATVGSLWVLARLLLLFNFSAPQINGWLLIAGASFGVWRFATESEVYIFPVLLSLAGSYYWARYILVQKTLFLVLAGLLAALACLYHQMHFFWWLGLLAGVVLRYRSFRFMMLFALPALLVPLAYVLTVVYYEQQELTVQNMLEYVLHDFYTGSAKSDMGISNFIFTGINLTRTFLQVHGLMFYMLKSNFLWILPALAAAAVLIWSLKNKPFRKSDPSQDFLFVGKTHAYILLMHLVFAWFAVGNAEFMVMIPFLLPLLPWVTFAGSFLQKAGVAFLIWNFFYGVFPLWHYPLSTTAKVTQLVKAQPETMFILDEAGKVILEYLYHFGESRPPNIIYSPSIRANRNKDLDELHQKIQNHLATGNPVYTDCLIKPKVITRSSLTVTDVDKEFFAPYTAIPVDSFATFYGMHYLHSVKL